jgi:integrase
MLSSLSTLSGDTGNCGRATERSSVARPRYQRGSLKAFGKNCWEIRWREDEVKADGSLGRIRRKERLRQMSKAQALEILDLRLAAATRQHRQPAITMPFSKFIETEWKPNAMLRLRNSSMRIYEYNLEKHVLPSFGEVPVRDLSRGHIESCLSALRQEGYAVSTLRSVRAAFSTVLEAAVSRQLISDNPAHGLRIREADSRPERRFYRQADVRRLLDKLEEPCRSVVVVAVLTGLRIGEILALRWKRVDLLNQTLEVAETFSSGEFGPPKTRSSRRVIPMSAALVGTLKHLRPAGCDPESLVFSTRGGVPLNPKNLYNRQLAPTCDRIKLPRISWHSFRHTHATMLHETGESLKTAQALLGHSDLETTLAVYTHVVPDSQRRAVERVAGVLDLDGPRSVSSQTVVGRPN